MTNLLTIEGCGILSVHGGNWMVNSLISIFLAILFLQSGLDKMFHYRGNRAWLKEHFSNSFLAGMVPTLMAVLTFFELATGLTCVAGAIESLFFKTFCYGLAGSLLAGVTLLMLFFGQRVAKDYLGAASLTPYFVVVMMHIYLLQ
jgi:hypothetical protein